MKVLTYATDSRGAYPQFLSSYERFKSPSCTLYVEGMGEKWQGFGVRVQKIYERAVKIAEVDPYEVVLCVDAYDLLITGDLDGCEAQFEKMIPRDHPDALTKILISEEYHFPMDHLFTKYLTFGTMQGKHPSAGAYIAYSGAVVHLLGMVLASPKASSLRFDDQVEFFRLGNLHPDLFLCDSEWKIFATLNDRRIHDPPFPLTYSKDGTLKKTQDNQPLYILHLPGDVNMTETIEKLGYDSSTYNWRGVFHTMQGFFHFFYFERCQKLIGFVLLFILCIILFIFKHIQYKRRK